MGQAALWGAGGSLVGKGGSSSNSGSSNSTRIEVDGGDGGGLSENEIAAQLDSR